LAEPNRLESFMASPFWDESAFERLGPLAENVRALINQQEQMRLELQSDPVLAQAGIPALDLYKNWHGLHYLLTGTDDPDATPLGQAILGGKEISGAEDTGYGVPRYLAPDQVKEIAAALALVSETDLTNRLASPIPSSAQIYCFHPDEGPE